MSSILEQYRITDFLEWSREKKLKLNPDFQRGSVWSPAARTFLIDTILRGFPIPKIYLRTAVDIATQTSYREVVDGQQRLRAIIDFASDKLVLSKRAGEYAGLKFSTLAPEHQQVFLAYPVSVGQLLNASDDDILEVFARLNSYTVRLNPAERRHAKFQGEFKWAVRNASAKWAPMFEKFKILSTRERVRMLDDSLVAEMFGVVLEGINDGGQQKIDKLYARHDSDFSDCNGSIQKVDAVLEFIVEHLAEDLLNTPLLRPPHFLMLFAVLAHNKYEIPIGALEELPNSRHEFTSDITQASSNLLELAAVIDSDSPGQVHEAFWKSSTSTTHRIASRRIRFPVYLTAINWS